MPSRRDFLCKGLLALGGISAASGCSRFVEPQTPPPERFVLRSITYNIFGGKGWSRARDLSGVMEESASRAHYAAMLKRYTAALAPYGAQIITIQEAPSEWFIQTLAKNLGMRYSYFKSPERWPGALLTRLRVVSFADCPVVGGKRPEGLFTYHWGRAVLRSPFGNLILHSVHLHATDDAIRDREIAEVLKVLGADLKSGRPVLVQGDLNHTPYIDDYVKWREAGLLDLYDLKGKGSELTHPADLPVQRFDYIWASADLAKHATDLRVLSEGLFVTTLADPTSPALSDHLPVMATFGNVAQAVQPAKK